jgi:hypothetical protein
MKALHKEKMFEDFHVTRSSMTRCMMHQGTVLAAGWGPATRVYDLRTRKLMRSYVDAHTEDVTQVIVAKSLHCVCIMHGSVLLFFVYKLSGLSILPCYICLYTHTHIYTQTHTCLCIYIRIHTHIYTQTHTCLYIYIYIYIYICTHTHTHTHTYMHTIHAYAKLFVGRIRMTMHSCMHITQQYTKMECMYVYVYIYKSTHSCICTQCSDKTHTHTHTHSLSLPHARSPSKPLTSVHTTRVHTHRRACMHALKTLTLITSHAWTNDLSHSSDYPSFTPLAPRCMDQRSIAQLRLPLIHTSSTAVHGPTIYRTAPTTPHSHL